MFSFQVCWDPTGHYIYSNSDEGDAICVYALASERPVQIITGAHQGQVNQLPNSTNGLLVFVFVSMYISMYDPLLMVVILYNDVLI